MSLPPLVIIGRYFRTRGLGPRCQLLLLTQGPLMGNERDDTLNGRVHASLVLDGNPLDSTERVGPSFLVLAAEENVIRAAGEHRAHPLQGGKSHPAVTILNVGNTAGFQVAELGKLVSSVSGSLPKLLDPLAHLNLLSMRENILSGAMGPLFICTCHRFPPFLSESCGTRLRSVAQPERFPKGNLGPSVLPFKDIICTTIANQNGSGDDSCM